MITEREKEIPAGTPPKGGVDQHNVLAVGWSTASSGPVLAVVFSCSILKLAGSSSTATILRVMAEVFGVFEALNPNFAKSFHLRPE